jgi:hypothetical protein
MWTIKIVGRVLELHHASNGQAAGSCLGSHWRSSSCFCPAPFQPLALLVLVLVIAAVVIQSLAWLWEQFRIQNTIKHGDGGARS